MRFFEMFLNWIRAHAVASSLVFLAASPFVAFEIYASDYATRYDDCTFGNVSNARYRELLWRARWLHWAYDIFRLSDPFADWGQAEAHQAADENLKRRVLDVSSGTDNPQELVAAFHAVMRSLSANLVRRTESGSAKYDLYTSSDLDIDGKNSIVYYHGSNLERNNSYILNADYLVPSLLDYVTICLFNCNRKYFMEMSNTISLKPQKDQVIIQIKNIKMTFEHSYTLGPLHFFDFANQFITFSEESPKCPWVPVNG